MIFVCVKSWENLSPIACTFAHLTCILLPLYLVKSKKLFFNSIIYTYLIIYIISEENKLLPPYPPHLKNVTALPCKVHKFFIWLKVCCIPPNVGGSEKNRLWCEANGMSGKQCYSKCSKWPPSVRIHASRLFCHWSTASSTMLCWNSAHIATRRCRSTTGSFQIHQRSEKRTYLQSDENVVHFTRQWGDIFQVWWVKR